MKLTYVKLSMDIKFNKDFDDINPLSSIIRGGLGTKLYDKHCIDKNNECIKCPHESECLYSQIFSPVIVVRDKKIRAIPPYRIEYIAPSILKETSIVEVNILLFGNAQQYVDQVKGIIQELESEGLGKERVLFKCDNIHSKQYDYKDILIPNDVTDIELEFLSPTKIIVKKKTLFKHISFDDLLKTVYRRNRQFLSEVYGLDMGYSYEEFYSLLKGCKCSHDSLTFYDPAKKYSTRSHKSFSIGGLMGKAVYSGENINTLINLLRFSSIIGIGKNGHIGHGMIKINY